MTVTDGINSCYQEITVNVTQPDLTFEVSPVEGFAPLTVNFSYTGQDELIRWNFGDGTSDSINTTTTHVYETPGIYNPVISINSGSPDYCPASQSVSITVNEKPYIEIPNFFTPNGDGINDYFQITSSGMQKMNVRIYDRWGIKMHEITEVDGKWDGLTESGKEALDGVYYFYLKAKGVDGLDYERKGSVTLIRDVINTYPNPVSDKVNLKVGSQLGDNLEIQVFSPDGKQRKSLSVVRSDIISIDISDLPDGFYILQLTDGVKIIHTKILKVSQ